MNKTMERRPKMAGKNSFDKEYYVMGIDRENNHPLLAWGKIDFSSFLEAKPVDEKQYELPMSIIFDEPYPVEYEMVDLHMLASCNVVSKRFKDFFEKINIYGIQFIPIEITSNTGEKMSQYFVAHFWNKLPAIDKNNYEGSPLNSFGTIRNLSKFSLDAKILEEIPLEKRQVFGLSEKKTLILVHQNTFDAIQKENFTGICFWKVSEWNDNV
jgi:hypothetical protein